MSNQYMHVYVYVCVCMYMLMVLCPLYMHDVSLMRVSKIFRHEHEYGSLLVVCAFAEFEPQALHEGQVLVMHVGACRQLWLSAQNHVHHCTWQLMVTVDNVVAAGGKRQEAMPHLGHGLPLMNNGDADPGTRQDILHAQKRITEKLSKAEGLSDTAGRLRRRLSKAFFSRCQIS